MAVMPGRFPLASLPTPLEPLRRLGRSLGTDQLYIKRDDLTGFGLAGSKARQLERLVADALDSGADVLVAGGGPTSNFCPAVAAAAAVAGLSCVLVLYGTPEDAAHPNLGLGRWAGAEVRFTGSPERRSVDTASAEVAAALAVEGRRPYVLPRGGATAVGVAGQVVAFREACRQLAGLGVDAATVVVASGSGGTQAGLVCGAADGCDRSTGGRWRVVGAAVSRPPGECEARVLDLSSRCARLLGRPPPGPGDVCVRDARGPGFAVASRDGERMARLAARTEGLLLDPTYTAKALATLADLLGEGLAGPVLFWHTGGIAGRLLAAGTPGRAA